MKILAFGEIVWDVYPDCKTLGGAPPNLAAHAVMMGAQAWMVSGVGRDELGKEALKQLEAFGVDTSLITVVPNRDTGRCIVTLDKNAVPSFDLRRDTAYDRIDTAAIRGGSYDALVFGTLSLREEHNLAAIRAVIENNTFAEIYTDLNIRPPFYSAQSITFCLQSSTVVKISDEELPLVTTALFVEDIEYQRAAVRLAERFPNLRLVIITRGAEGSYCYDSEHGNSYACKAVKTTAVSTVGAGDSFGAAFLVRYFAGDSVAECLDAASRLSAFVVSKTDAIPPETPDFIKAEFGGE